MRWPSNWASGEGLGSRSELVSCGSGCYWIGREKRGGKGGINVLAHCEFVLLVAWFQEY